MSSHNVIKDLWAFHKSGIYSEIITITVQNNDNELPLQQSNWVVFLKKNPERIIS